MRALHELSIVEIGSLLRQRALTSQELTDQLLARIAKLNPLLHAFVLVTEARAREDAERADDELASGIDRGPLHGVPYALKDVFATAGIPTTCHSKLLLHHVPDKDCTVERSLRDAGAVLLGKLATHEFALGGPSPELPFPPARNPWNPEYFTGASSTGSAAAVAAGFAPLALGSDTSGSIRGPACHCGVVGLKPTYGRVSRRGVFPLSYSMDHCGPLTWTVSDAAVALQCIAGHDPHDPSSAEARVEDFSARIGEDLRGLRIGLCRSFFASLEVTSAELVAGFDAVAERLVELGAQVEEVELPGFSLFNACGRVIMMAEAYAIHEQDLRERPREYGRYTYQRIMAAAGLTAADLVQAFRLRRELAESVDGTVLRDFDALVTAVCLTPPARLDEFPIDWPPPAAATATLTIPFNVTGHPALAVPTGFYANGLPMGVQIIGRAFDEATVLRIGAAYEKLTDLTAHRPALGTN